MMQTRGQAQRGTWSLLAALGGLGCGSAAHPIDDPAHDAGAPGADAGSDAGEMCEPSCPLLSSAPFVGLRLAEPFPSDDEDSPELELELDLSAASQEALSDVVRHSYPALVAGQPTTLELTLPAGVGVAALPPRVRYREAFVEAPCANSAGEEEFISAEILRDTDGALLFASFFGVVTDHNLAILALPSPEMSVSLIGSAYCWSCDSPRETRGLITGFFGGGAPEDEPLVIQGVRPDPLSLTLKGVPYELKVEKSRKPDGENVCGYVAFSLARADLVSGG